MALREVPQLGGVDFGNVALIHEPPRQFARLDQLPQPFRRLRVVFVVVMHGALSLVRRVLQLRRAQPVELRHTATKPFAAQHGARRYPGARLYLGQLHKWRALVTHQLAARPCLPPAVAAAAAQLRIKTRMRPLGATDAARAHDRRAFVNV
jgi:hypothetical protein